MRLKRKKEKIFPIIAGLVFITLTIIGFDYCFFWDNIQLTSKDAHWYFLQNSFELIIPKTAPEGGVSGTGHPPLMGLMSSFLWKIFGYKLAVIHVFILGWSILLIYNLNKLTQRFFTHSYSGWILLIIILEPTILSQFIIASSDFILFTAFVICIRAILEKKPITMGFTLFFVCAISIRGIFIGVILFATNQIYIYLSENKKINTKQFFVQCVPFLPVFIILTAYYIVYFTNNGWFFSEQEQVNGHYAKPSELYTIFKHIFEFALRALENGRFFIWVLFLYAFHLLRKKKIYLNIEHKTLLTAFSLLFGLYFLFIFITQMPFSSRYFAPFFFLITILSLSLIFQNSLTERRKYLIIALILLFELTGNCWYYPEKMAKAWDCSLMHLPYYSLRKDCFEYIDKNKLDYEQIGAGFSICGNRKYIELGDKNRLVHADKNREYYIYSNICNEKDEFIDEINNPEKWTSIKKFQKGFVTMTLYKRNSFQDRIHSVK